QKALGLIGKLGDDSFDVRQEAHNSLKAMGSSVVPLLKQATKNPDPEVRQQIGRCLAELEKDKVGAPLSPVTLRVLALRRPPCPCSSTWSARCPPTGRPRPRTTCCGWRGARRRPRCPKGTTAARSARRCGRPGGPPRGPGCSWSRAAGTPTGATRCWSTPTT